MENYEDLQDKFEIIKICMDIFYYNFNKYMNFKNEDEVENFIIIIFDSEKQLEMIIQNLEVKFNEIELEIDTLKICNFKDDLESLKKTLVRLKQMFYKKKEENKIIKNRIFLENNEFNKKVSNNIVINKNNEISFLPEIMEVHYRLQSVSNEFQLQLELQTENQKEFQGETETLKKINEVKNQISLLTQSIQKENIKTNQTLLEIEENVDECNNKIEESNEELRKAAILKNKKNTLKYPIILGSVLGVVGTVIPGIGNIIGATLGAAVGAGIANLEKRSIKNIEPEKYK